MKKLAFFNTFEMDPQEKWRLEELEKRDARNAEWMAEREAAAINETGKVEIIQPGDTEHVAQMSFDYSQGWEQRAYSRLRAAKARGMMVKPRQIINHGTHNESVFESEIELEPFQRGEACVRCSKWQPDSDAERAELHRRLEQETSKTDFPFKIPDGLTIRDCCCACGARLDTQQYAS